MDGFPRDVGRRDETGRSELLDDAAPEVGSAARILAAGGIVVYPTETLYGLGADALNLQALERLVRLKGREPGKPISVLVSDTTMLSLLVADIPPLARRLMQRFWPGPLTIVFAASASVPEALSGGSGGIGVRVSSHPVATALVRALGKPLTTPSANPAGQPPPVTIAEARGYFGKGVDEYLDGGRLPGEPASTVVDVRQGLRVVREGAVPASLLS
ncbi:MAG: threonylcarbamoyl-AMP synthase [Deltaproteobacteria bacterium]|nr:threonylcarbamoyl-AMP synthase [Deltaproteobacteria bacterium]